MKNLATILFLLISIAFSCSAPKISQTSLDTISNFWIHSHEEDVGKIRVYHPDNFDFQASRGREKFRLYSDGKLEYIPISPNDKPIKYSGTWIIEKSKLKFNYDEKTIDFKIVEIENETLKLEIK